MRLDRLSRDSNGEDDDGQQEPGNDDGGPKMRDDPVKDGDEVIVAGQPHKDGAVDNQAFRNVTRNLGDRVSCRDEAIGIVMMCLLTVGA